jgi:hypothetical protein
MVTKETPEAPGEAKEPKASAEPPKEPEGGDRADGEPEEGGGPKNDKETVSREFHDKRLRREVHRRDQLAAANRKLQDEVRRYREAEAKKSSASLLDGLGLPPEQKPVADVLGKLTERLMTTIDEKLGSHAERVKELSDEFHVERRRSAFRNLDDDQMELAESIATENPSLRPVEVLALAKMRDPELFAGYDSETSRGEPAPARGMTSQRKEPPSIDDQIAKVKKELDAAVAKGQQEVIHTQLGPKLMGLQRMKAKMTER